MIEKILGKPRLKLLVFLTIFMKAVLWKSYVLSNWKNEISGVMPTRTLF